MDYAIISRMEKILYLEGASGISGDMTVGALLDLGGDEAKLRSALASIPFDGYGVTIEKKRKWGLAGVSFDVELHHDNEHAHGHEHAHDHGHAHGHGHRHEHRNLADVKALIASGNLTERARSLAEKAFEIVAAAEAKAHGTSIEEVHFHEVGAIDSICDIVAAAVLFDDLGISKCVVTGLSEGAGLVECAHGALPVPVPAVLNIAEAYGITLRAGTADTELVTPTGIALAATFRTSSTLPTAFRVAKTGIGFGTREIGRANCLRAMLIEPVAGNCGEAACADEVFVLETNVDDATGEELGIAMKALFAAGARDCHFMPCFMKKNRPGWLVRVIADAVLVPEIERVIFRTTTAIGVRRYPVSRTTMARENVRVAVTGGDVDVKRCTFGDIKRFYPEADSVNAIAERTGTSFHDVYAEAAARAATAYPG